MATRIDRRFLATSDPLLASGLYGCYAGPKRSQRTPHRSDVVAIRVRCGHYTDVIEVRCGGYMVNTGPMRLLRMLDRSDMVAIRAYVGPMRSGVRPMR